ncbi:MAG: hypothetical protein IPN22_14290 [Bacteroidetes bacterium]|nr:hypothetical protein [Bacteroidota bacterium]
MNASASNYEMGRVNDSLVNKLKRIVSSATMLLTAYALVQLLVQACIFCVSLLLGYTVKFGYHWVMVKPYEYEYWGNIRVMLIYLLPPILCLIGAYAIQFTRLGKDGSVLRIRMFWFWLHACFINVFLTQLFIMPVGINGGLTGLYQTFSIVASWFRMNPTLFVPATVIAGSLAIVWGLLSSPQLLKFSFSARLITSLSGKDAIVRQVYLFPIILAAPVIAVVSNQYSFLMHLVSIMLLILPVLGTIIRHRTDAGVVMCSREDVLNQWPVAELLMAAVIWAAVILLFNH